MPPGDELSGYPVYPFACVLGGHQRWLDAIMASDDDGSRTTTTSARLRPAGWHLRDLPAPLKRLITTVSSSFFSR